MQNNVTELTQRLLRALDSNYNVRKPGFIEIFGFLCELQRRLSDQVDCAVLLPF